MRSRKDVVCVLLVVLAALVTFACSSGNSGNSLFFGAAAQGTFFGTSGGTGTSSGGSSETWNVNIDHVNNTFSASDLTTGKNYSGTVSIPPSKFTENVTTTSNDTSLTLPATGHSIEVTDALVLLHLDDNSQNVTPLVNTKGQCPAMTNGMNFNLLRYGWKFGWDSTTQPAYSKIAITNVSGNSFTATETSFKLDGTSFGVSAPQTISCSNAIFTGGGGGGTPAFSPTELLGISGPTCTTGPGSGCSDHSEVFFPDPAGPSIATIVAGQYVGMVFNQTFAHVHPVKVGFGPGAGSTITGGAFTNIKTDAFSAHANNISITFAAGPSPGLLTGSVTDVNGVHSPMIVQVMTTKDGKFQLFMLTTDGSSTAPYHIFLSGR